MSHSERSGEESKKPVTSGPTGFLYCVRNAPVAPKLTANGLEFFDNTPHPLLP
jgi:hypothetical protein